ncbi:MAG: peptidoglycan-binding protein, partial [Planctomycetes bacterium]|nr:peptidoglycan-binding protein [Planctomycetota bacterium]
VVSMGGCKNPVAQGSSGSNSELAEQMDTRFDEIQAQLAMLQSQIQSSSVSPAPAQEPMQAPLTLNPVEPQPASSYSSEATKRARIAQLAQKPRYVATRQTSSKKTTRKSSSKSSVSKEKQHIRVAVPVATIQTALQNAGMNPGKIDGRVGERTIAAIRAFQAKEGLKADGIVGAQTWSKLQAYAAAR